MIAKVNGFYECPVRGCNRKYKTEGGLAFHIESHSDKKDEHGWIVIDDSPPERRIIEKKPPRMSADEFESATGIALENLALPVTNKQKKGSVRKRIEERDEQLHQLKVQAEQAHINKVKKELVVIEKVIEIEQRNREHPDQCAICMDRPTRGAAVIPCGHACFCYECLTANTKNGCPVCRAPVIKIQKIFI